MRIIEMVFTNMLSYREETVVDFSNPGVTIINGVNGAGKSSIPTILEELLYNKNSHGLTKAEIPHRYSKDQSYSGSVMFEVDGAEYKLIKNVKSTTKLQLLKDGEDISGHTNTQTYQLVESIVGLDFSTFSKLVNQSMDSSLDFLSATDAKRKEFLVALQNLERYYKVEERIKEDKKVVDAELTKASARVTTSQKWLQSLDITPELPLLDEPSTQEVDQLNEKIQNWRQEIGGITSQLNYAESHNQRIISQKQKLTNALAQVDRASKTVMEKYISALPTTSSDLQSITYDIGGINSRMSDIKQKHTKLKADAQITSCPTCHTKLDKSATVALVNEMAAEYKTLKAQLQDMEESRELLKKYAEYEKAVEALDKHKTDAKLLEEEFKDEPLIDIKELQQLENKHKTDIKLAEAEIARVRKEVQEIRRANDEIKANNASRKTKIEQAEKHKTDLNLAKELEEKLTQESNDLGLLAKSTKDLVGYKIESNIKVFEALINKNLQELSDGQFGIGFELDKTKLGVIVFDHGVRVSLKALSSGEKSLVHVATLLAIRDTMTHSYGEDLNLLFLDEVISVLDPDKKNTLVSLLLKIKDMSIFLVSHGYNNQLTKSLLVEKHPEGYSTIVKEY